MTRARKTILLVFATFLLVIGYMVVRALTYPLIRITTGHEIDPQSGYNLFAPTADDLGYALDEPNFAYLFDMHGKITHQWNVLGAIQLAKLKPDGNLLYTTRDRSFSRRAGVREIDPFGNVLWYYPCWADHDFYPFENGDILIHYIEDIHAPEIGSGEIRCPRIVRVTPDGEVIWQWRAEEHLTELTSLVGIEFPLAKEGRKLFDWAHNNACRVIGENDAYASDPRFRPGNIIFSYPNLSTIGVISSETGEIVWAWGPGVLDGQHNPRMLDNGNILIFDNGTERGYSRVIEVDPLSEEIVWEYNDKDSKSPRFFAPFVSSAQRLPNGNIFVCQGTYTRNDPVMLFYRAFYKVIGQSVVSSRIFEVNRTGEIVWDCTITAHGKNLHGVYQAVRYPAPYVEALLATLREVDGDATRRLRSLPYIR